MNRINEQLLDQLISPFRAADAVIFVNFDHIAADARCDLAQLALLIGGRLVTTVARWKRQGWRTDINPLHPLDEARAALDSIAPLLTGDPISKAEDVAATVPCKEKHQGMSDAELLSQAARELSMTFIGVASAIRSSVTSLVATKPRELALVVEALVACCKAADHAHAQADHMKREEPLALK